MCNQNRVNARKISALSLLSSTVAAIYLNITSPVTAQQPIQFMMDFLPSGEYAAYYAGWTKGFWKEEGIDITVTRGYGSSDTVTKVANGAAEFGVGDLGAMLTARNRAGAPVKAISSLYTYSPHAFFVLESSGIRSIRELAGKRLGITPGNSHRIYFPEVAKRVGIDENAITWVSVDASAMGTLLIQKQIDAAPLYSIHHYFNNKAAKTAGESIRVLPYVQTGFKIYSSVVFTADKTLTERPELVKSFLRGLQKSLLWAKDNREEACKLHVARVSAIALDDCLGSLNATLELVFNTESEGAAFGKFNADQLKFTYRMVAKAQDLKTDWDPQQAVDTSLLPAR